MPKTARKRSITMEELSSAGAAMIRGLPRDEKGRLLPAEGIGRGRRAKQAAALSAVRTTFAGGRPKKMTACPGECGQDFSARELKLHLPHCPNKKKGGTT